jgi:transposase-like protein
MLSNSFRWNHHEGEIILLNVRWYLKYPLCYINLKGMMIERKIQVDHSTIMRGGPLQKKILFNDTIPKNVGIRQIKYLNNIIEQGHRSIKRIVNSMLGFPVFSIC